VAFTKIPLPALPFRQGSHPLERRKRAAHDAVAVLEFAAGFADPDWCRRAHVFYVMRGTLTLELEGSRETVAEGECCVLDGGTPHRASNEGADPVLVFAVSDLEPSRR
jgi:mannose-6-phosphate isomerase-like protein (cupin superfamily)